MDQEIAKTGQKNVQSRVKGFIMTMNCPVFFPTALYKEFDFNNKKLPANAPVCLILVSDTDRGGELNIHSMQFLFRTISETHRVALKLIKNRDQIGPALAKTEIKFNHKVNKLTYFGHGTDTTISLGKVALTAEELVPRELDSMDPNGEFHLIACNTGKKLARQLADLSKRSVFAPLTELSSNDIFLSRNTFIRSTSPYVHILNSGQLIQYSHHSRSVMDDSYLKGLQEYTEQYGTPFDLCLLGQLMIKEGQTDQGKHYLTMAADEGFAPAQYDLGVWLLISEETRERGKTLIQQAAEQGYPPAQYNPASLLSGSSG